MLWLRKNTVLPVYQIITLQTVSLCVLEAVLQIHFILIRLRIRIVEKLIRPKKEELTTFNTFITSDYAVKKIKFL